MHYYPYNATISMLIDADEKLKEIEGKGQAKNLIYSAHCFYMKKQKIKPLIKDDNFIFRE